MAVLQKDDARPFGKQTQFFEDMVNYYDPIRLQLVFFSPYAWDSQLTSLEGLIFKNGVWQQCTTQKPSLIYDRSFSRDAKEKDWLVAFRSSLKPGDVTLFNPTHIQELSTNKETCARWQLSHGFTVLRTVLLTDLLSNHAEDIDRLYLKPKSGSRGIGVMKLHRIGDQHRLYFDQNSFKDFSSTKSLADYLSTSINIADYIAQEEANLYEFRKAPFDIRIMVQIVNGLFSITGEAVRLGNKEAIVSNLSSGGSAISVAEFQNEIDDAEADNITKELDQARNECLVFANALKQEFGNFAELGFDVLLTKDKGPIILEVNAKPSRWVFVQIADHEQQRGNDPSPFLDMRKRTVINPIAYAESILLG